MKSISLYVDQDTYLTRLHPFSKLFYIAAAVCVPLIAGRLWAFGVFIAVSLTLLVTGRVIRKALPLMAFSFTLIGTVFLVHGLFHQANQQVLWTVGPLKFYKEGLLYAARIGFHIFNLLLAFAAFVLSTQPSRLVEDLEQIGFPPKFGYILSSVFQIIPQMLGTVNTIMDAQRSRGMETEGSLFARARAFIPLISPAVSSSLISTRERAIALEVRGFEYKGRKTYLRDHKLCGRDKRFIAAMAGSVIAAVLWRICYVMD